MRILVIGKHGQLARSLSVAASSKGSCKLACVGRPELDICDRESLRAQLAAFAPDVVINTAAFTAVDRAEAESAQAFRLNAEGAGYLSMATAAVRSALIHVSTDYVFSGDLDRPYREDDVTDPLNAYGRSKLAGERAAINGNPRTVIARTAWLYSPWGVNFLKTMLRLANERAELQIVGDQIGSPTYALDLAHALLVIAERTARAEDADQIWGIYHVANTGVASWYELAAKIFLATALFGATQPRLTRIETHQYPTPAVRPKYTALDTAKFESAFGVRLRPWQDAVQDCVQKLLQPN